jgi:hypothetical protein
LNFSLTPHAINIASVRSRKNFNQPQRKRGFDYESILLRTAAMKLRHAAALIPMVWYLLIPPAGGDEHSALNLWQMVNVFESEEACQAGRQKYYNDGIELLKMGKTSTAAEESRRFTHAACAAADDPRLQGK